MARFGTFILAGSMFALLLLSSGCFLNPYGGDAGRRARSLAAEAREKARAGDFAEASQLYIEAASEDPGYARAHFDLAVLLQDHLEDYIGCIYHYRRYMKLKPDTDKREMINERIRVAMQSLAGKVEKRSGKGSLAERELVEECARLRKENQRLKGRVARLENLLEKSGDSAGGGQAGRSSAPDAAGAGGRAMQLEDGEQLYRVRSGDTLMKISARMYGTEDKAELIFRANRHRLDSPDALRPGQVLVIPENQ